MIKAAGRNADGTATVILGLTGENMARLMADEPIVVDLAELGIEGGTKVALIGGKDEAAIAAQLAPLMHGDTVVHRQERADGP